MTLDGLERISIDDVDRFNAVADAHDEALATAGKGR